MSPHPDKYKFNKGFTIVETLVALVVLTVGLIPAFLQASSAVQLTGQVRNSLTAAYLAQEGVEVVDALRDSNWFAGHPFDFGLNLCPIGCLVQYDSTALLPLGLNPPLKLDPATGLYQYIRGTDTNFTRKVTITESANNHDLKVVSEIDWTDHGVGKSFIVEAYLFDWLK